MRDAGILGMKAMVHGGRGGRLRVDESGSLGDGAVPELVLDDDNDDLDAKERRALHDAISMAWASAKSGRVRPAQVVIEALRSREGRQAG